MIELEAAPELVDPVVVAAFEGWNDAGEAATTAIEHVEGAWRAQPMAALDPDDYYDFQVNRPTMEDTGEGRRITWPTTRLSFARVEGSEHDIVLVRGIEPNMRWRGFCAELLEFAVNIGAERIISLGALLADAPHTRPIPVTGIGTGEELTSSPDLESPKYEGPIGIVGVLQDACARAEVPAVSLWAEVPHYVAQTQCPKATLALLRHLEDLLGVTVPLDDLPEQARAWEHGVDELAAQDDEVAEYVRTLEQQKDETSLPEASGEAIAREFERYLRSHGNDT